MICGTPALRYVAFSVALGLQVPSFRRSPIGLGKQLGHSKHLAVGSRHVRSDHACLVPTRRPDVARDPAGGGICGQKLPALQVHGANLE